MMHRLATVCVGGRVGAPKSGIVQGSTVFDLIYTILCVLFTISLKLFSPFLPSVALVEFSLCSLIPLLIQKLYIEVFYGCL